MCSYERVRLVGGLVICKMDLVQKVLLVSRWSLG